jgi:hypothetical protein
VEIVNEDFCDISEWYTENPSRISITDKVRINTNASQNPARIFKLKRISANSSVLTDINYYFNSYITENYTLITEIKIFDYFSGGINSGKTASLWVNNGSYKMSFSVENDGIYTLNPQNERTLSYAYSPGNGEHCYKVKAYGENADFYIDGGYKFSFSMPADTENDDVGIESQGSFSDSCVFEIKKLRVEKNTGFNIIKDNMANGDVMYASDNIAFNGLSSPSLGQRGAAGMENTSCNAEVIYRAPENIYNFEFHFKVNTANQGGVQIQASQNGITWKNYVNGSAGFVRKDVYSNNGARFSYTPTEAMKASMLGVRYIKIVFLSENQGGGTPAAGSPLLQGSEIYYGYPEGTAELYISNGGNDGNSGAFEEPLKTFTAVKSKIKKMKINGELPKGGLTVYIRGGKYYFPETLTFNENDNGFGEPDITYRAYGNEKAVFSGGIKLDGSSFTGDGILEAALSDYNITEFAEFEPITFGENAAAYHGLTLDGKPMQLARCPNNGLLELKDIGVINSQNTVEINLPPANLGGAAFLEGYIGRDWAWESNKILSRDGNFLTLAKTSAYDLRPETRFRIINALGLLDAPNEWYLDRNSGILYFKPPYDIRGSEIIFQINKTGILDITNASGITFYGITFEDTYGNAIQITNGENINIISCVIRNIGNNALVHTNTPNSKIADNDIYNIGAAGVYVYAGDRVSLTPGNVSVTNNHISGFAKNIRTYKAGISLNGAGNTASNNLIHDAPHVAVLFSQNNMLIEYNEIYNVLLETDDAGAIYGGRDLTARGNIIRYNNIHDSGGFSTVWGIYLDDMMSGASICGNIINNLPAGILMGGGRDNIITDNILANLGVTAISADSRGTADWFSGMLSGLLSSLSQVPYQNESWRNAYPDLYDILNDEYNKPKRNDIRNNALYNSSVSQIHQNVSDFGGVSNNVSYGRECFVNAGAGDFRLGKEAVKTIPVERIGLTLNENRNKPEKNTVYSLADNMSLKFSGDAVKLYITNYGGDENICVILAGDSGYKTGWKSLDENESGVLDVLFYDDAGKIFIWDNFLKMRPKYVPINLKK